MKADEGGKEMLERKKLKKKEKEMVFIFLTCIDVTDSA